MPARPRFDVAQHEEIFFVASPILLIRSEVEERTTSTQPSVSQQSRRARQRGEILFRPGAEMADRLGGAEAAEATAGREIAPMGEAEEEAAGIEIAGAGRIDQSP